MGECLLERHILDEKDSYSKIQKHQFFLCGYYVNSKIKLMEFVIQYDEAVTACRVAELNEDFMNLNKVFRYQTLKTCVF